MAEMQAQAAQRACKHVAAERFCPRPALRGLAEPSKFGKTNGRARPPSPAPLQVSVEAAEAVLGQFNSSGYPWFRLHPKGRGVIVARPQGVPAFTLVEEYFGELHTGEQQPGGQQGIKPHCVAVEGLCVCRCSQLPWACVAAVRACTPMHFLSYVHVPPTMVTMAAQPPCPTPAPVQLPATFQVGAGLRFRMPSRRSRRRTCLTSTTSCLSGRGTTLTATTSSLWTQPSWAASPAG